jgi:DNA-binding NtrC family response regulator
VRKLLILRDPNMIAAEIEAMQRATGRTNPARLGAGPAVTPLRSLQVAPNKQTAQGLAEVARAQKEAETEVILAALHATHWNRKMAAARLQIDYKAFLYKMRKLSIEEQARAEPVSA